MGINFQSREAVTVGTGAGIHRGPHSGAVLCAPSALHTSAAFSFVLSYIYIEGTV
jgi:hypothetical protein